MSKPDDNQQYRVLFRGKVAKKFTREQVTQTLAKMLRRPADSLTPIFEGEQKISFNRRPLDFQTAVKLKVKLLRLGLVTDIQAIGSPEPAPAGQPEAKARTSETSPTDGSEEHRTPPQPDTSGKTSTSNETDTPPPPTEAEPEPQPARSGKAPDAAGDEPVQRHDEPDTVIRMQAPPPPDRIIDVTAKAVEADDEPADDAHEEPSTSETILHESPYLQPWWRRALTLPVLGTALLLLALAGYWIYRQTVFTPIPAAIVVENHLATDDLGMIGLIDIDKLRKSNRWMGIGANALPWPADLEMLQSLGIDIGKQVASIIVSEHDRPAGIAGSVVLLGDFDKPVLRSALEHRGAQANDDNHNRLTLTLADEQGCERDLAFHLGRNEVIIAPPDFIETLYRMIHDDFEGKPAMLKRWRSYRKHHPVSFSVFDGETLSAAAETLLLSPLGGIEKDTIDELLAGMSIADILTSEARLTAQLRFTNRRALENAKTTVTGHSPFAGSAMLRVEGNGLEFTAPLPASSLTNWPWKKLSFLGLCPG